MTMLFIGSHATRTSSGNSRRGLFISPRYQLMTGIIYQGKRQFKRAIPACHGQKPWARHGQRKLAATTDNCCQGSNNTEYRHRIYRTIPPYSFCSYHLTASFSYTFNLLPQFPINNPCERVHYCCILRLISKQRRIAILLFRITFHGNISKSIGKNAFGKNTRF